MSLMEKTLEELSDAWVTWVVIPLAYFVGGYLLFWVIARKV